MAKTVLFTVVAIVLLFLLGPVNAWDYTTRESVASNGTEGNYPSVGSAVSANGRFVAFYSQSANLVTGDTNSVSDVFEHDRATGAITRVSVATGGIQSNGDSSVPSISADGRYVAFQSPAGDLVTGDTNSAFDVFVHDRNTQATTRVSVNSSGGQADSGSYTAAISGDGMFVAFSSDATNLVPGDTNGATDVFVHDRTSGATTRVSVATGGIQSGGGMKPFLSTDGRYVAFESSATDLVTGDTNGVSDIFVHDRLTGTTTRVSVALGGVQATGGSYDPSISGDGRYVAFYSFAADMVVYDTNGVSDVFVYDRNTQTTAMVSINTDGTEGNGPSGDPSISADGKCIAFASLATNLGSGDTNGVKDIFLYGRTSGVTTRVSVGTGGTEATGQSSNPSVSGDGRKVAFSSQADDLVPGDGNACDDVFVHTDAIRKNAVFRPSASDNWIFTDNLLMVTYRDHYGLSTDKPLVGDFNNDGVSDRAVFRNGNWIVDYSMDGSVNSNTPFGMAGDIPLAGYFNSDRITDRAVFRSGQWIEDWNLDGSVNRRTSFGMGGDVPLVGDINRDGTPDRAVFRSGQWIIDLGMDGSVDSRTNYGLSTDIPLAGWIDDNTVMDRAVFRNGEWIMDYSIDGSVDWRPWFGTAGDKPLLWVEI